MLRMQQDPYRRGFMDSYAWNTGMVLFDQTWRLRYTVCNPQTETYATNPLDVWNLAKNSGTNWAYVNAPSYSMAAMAIYAQQYLHMSKSPIPRAILYPAVSSSNASAPGLSTVDAPPGFVEASDPNIANSQPDLSVCAAIQPNQLVNKWTQIAGPTLSSTNNTSTSSATQTLFTSSASPVQSSITAAASPVQSSITAAASPVQSSITAAASPFCAKANSVPVGVPQPLAQDNITAWCGIWPSAGAVGCDNKPHNGFYLSTSCQIPSIALDYDYPDVIMTLNVSITQGATFTMNYTACNQTLSAILNDCPNTYAAAGQTLWKFGGNETLDDGAGNAALFSMKLTSNPGNPGNQPGDPGTTSMIGS